MTISASRFAIKEAPFCQGQLKEQLSRCAIIEHCKSDWAQWISVIKSVSIEDCITNGDNLTQTNATFDQVCTTVFPTAESGRMGWRKTLGGLDVFIPYSIDSLAAINHGVFYSPPIRSNPYHPSDFHLSATRTEEMREGARCWLDRQIVQ